MTDERGYTEGGISQSPSAPVMIEHGSGEAILRDAVVPVPPERAFEHFVAELHAWWPSEYTWSGDVLERVGIEPYEGGLCFELGPHGFRCDWGRPGCPE